ncbi:MAG: flagellar motor protein MotB [Actinobacteria bacterium]|nr:flagellar motor protein MotB [Actinomycetota bacterium]
MPNMRRRLKRPPASGNGAPAWIVTYGDMVTLLLVFFVMLFSFSVVSPKKFSTAIGSIQEAMTGSNGRQFKVMDMPEKFEVVSPGSGDPAEQSEGLGQRSPIQDLKKQSKIGIPQTEVRAMEQLKHQLTKEFEGTPLSSSIEMEVTERGLVIRLNESILFQKGKAELRPPVYPALKIIGGTLASTNYSIKVEGYTCDLPISTPQFPSNWELSTARAISVLRFFVENQNIESSRLAVSGYGEYKPVAPNSSDVNRAQNRRVEIVVLFPTLNIQEPRQ